MANTTPSLPSPSLVALVAWLVPGGGYWLLGEKQRAMTVGITIATLFVLGLLVGGVRVLEVPGFGAEGQKLVVSVRQQTLYGRDGEQRGTQLLEKIGESVDPGFTPVGSVLVQHPLSEIRNKPWSIAQVMTGPLGIVAATGSVLASKRPGPPEESPPPGARSHARLQEIGVLYTAVAGMLNLMVIIDAAYRAGQTEAK